MLQLKDMVYSNFCNSSSFCLLYLQVRHNQNRPETCKKCFKNQT